MQVISRIYYLLIFTVLIKDINAQENFENSIFYKPVLNIGIQTGIAQYFGDLNPTFNLNAIRPSQAIYIGKEIYNRNIGFKVLYQRHRLYAADKHARDSIQLIRNLDFTTDVDEVALLFHVPLIKNLFRSKQSRLFLQFGMGYFWFNPFTNYNNQKIYLQPLGTEGQFSYLNSKITPYQLSAISLPFGFQWKSTLSNYLRFCIEFNYRFTSTGYLDDVFGFYAGFESFPTSGEGYNGEYARILQNRSNEIIFGIKGTPRGNLTNDQFMSFSIGLEYQLWKNQYKYRLKYQKQSRPTPEKK